MTRRSGWARYRPGTTPLIAVTAIVVALFAGIGGAVAVAVLTWTVHRHLRRRRVESRRMVAANGLAEALELLVGDLRSGAHPASAIESVIADVDQETEKPLRAMLSTARLGGDVRSALDRFIEVDPVCGPALRHLGAVWDTAEKHGVPLAELVEAVHRDLGQRIRFAHQVDSRMAGPRATAAVLAALPVVGLLLGEAMGAAPLVVLVRTGFGQVLLVLGAVLMCAGLAWSTHLTSRAVAV
ncbi:type II secretion system F family protein [Allokutzneria oryzae]|uniref:Type II secretion system F family protein n=1 Tax=Allokutzneria oryzae TaxID=1378989 RepID=A0ABV5ZZA8_9PSEU